MKFSDDQASSSLTLEDGRVLTACDQCREFYADRKEEPPCNTCRVDLLPENREAGQIFQLVRYQVITIFNGQYAVPVDLNHTAVLDVMRLMKVQDKVGCFRKVLYVFHKLNAERQKNEN